MTAIATKRVTFEEFMAMDVPHGEKWELIGGKIHKNEMLAPGRFARRKVGSRLLPTWRLRWPGANAPAISTNKSAYPGTSTVRVFRGNQTWSLGPEDTLEDSELLPGFRVFVAELFKDALSSE